MQKAVRTEDLQDSHLLRRYLQGLCNELRGLDAGAVATYIPELGRADPSGFGIALTMTDGTQVAAGDAAQDVTIQSVSKPFMYGAALSALGRDEVMAKVGVEPTGESFNAIVLDERNNRPFNPMVNAGAIAVSSLLSGGDAPADEARMLGLFSDLAGRALDIDLTVLASETETGHRNRAIAWLMLNSGMIEGDPDRVLDLYFRQCSVLVDCRDLSVMAATLANGGTNPLTGRQVYSPAVTQDVLSVMATCGMYDYAGQWIFDVGLPAKSGVSGLVCAVVPGQFGLAVWSPRLDGVGNSVRGIEVCRRMVSDFGLHSFAAHLDPGAVIRREYSNAEVTSNRERTAAQNEILSVHGRALKVIELQGPLYFASAEKAVRRAGQLAAGCETLILDFRHAGSIDTAAAALLGQLPGALAGSGCRLCFTGLGTRTDASELEAALATVPADSLARFADTDHAIEAHEDALIAREARPSDGRLAQLAELGIFEGIAPGELAALEKVATMLSFATGQRIITAGDEARAFFVVARGQVDILVAMPDGQERRVSSVGPGQSFGEMALLDGAPRSAHADAHGEAICFVFSIAAIREIARDRPALLNVIYANLIRSLSGRLRQANSQIIAYE
ncbi:glutaminase A [Mangrovicoccus sp. HB161399]|uniref:glutaminase A n=1 Tax=Mangrovicoccus sp. HB161399 TaxID=2720392 RepID=UPI0015574351|nr:glutaminase A [Mangrovicoccus sp. HB161399]